MHHEPNNQDIHGTTYQENYWLQNRVIMYENTYNLEYQYRKVNYQDTVLQ